MKSEKPSRSPAHPSRWTRWAALLAIASNPLHGATLQVERSEQVDQWIPVPITPGQLLPDGAIAVPSGGESGFFRLRIDGATGPVLSLDRMPAEAVALARDFVDRHNAAAAAGDADLDGVFDFDDLVALGPIGALYFDPAHDGGQTPAYAEFKLVRPPAPRPPGTAVPDQFFRDGAAEPESRPDGGYVTVCLHRGDLPISAHTDQGPARFEKLLARIPAGKPVRLVRFDDAFMVAEDAAGQPLASLGSAPYLPDPGLLEMPPEGYTLEIGTAAPPPDDLGPRLVPAAAENYGQFLQAWRENPVFQRIREARAAVADEAWDFAGDGPKTVSIDLRETVVLNDATRPALRAESSDPESIGVEVDAASGEVRATGLADGDSLVTVWYPDGSRERCIVEAGPGDPIPQRGAALAKTHIPGQQAGWALIGTRYSSAFKDQPHYTQVKNDPQMCSTTVSGCGPTAWAILFGFWDRNGYPRLFADPAKADAPFGHGNPVNPSVRDCTRWLFDAVDGICFPKLDRTATLPTTMHRGLNWASHRNQSMTGTIKSGLPYLSPGCQQLARDAIVAGRISIVGIGTYSHYPLAYGYRRWEWKTKKGKTLRTTFDLRLNMGWGESPPEWRSIEQIWYATSVRPQ